MIKKIKKGVWVDIATQADISQGDVNRAMKTLTERGTKILDTDQVSIWRMNVTGDEMVCADCFNKISGVHTSGERLSILKYPDFFSTIQSVDVIKAQVVSLDPQTQELTDVLWSPVGVQSNLSVPMWEKGKFEGVVLFDQIQSQREWQSEDVNAAWRITHLASQTLLVAASRKIEERINLVTQAVERIPHEENRTETLTDLLGVVVNLMEGDSGILYLCDVAHQEIHVEAVNNIPVKYKTERFVYGEGIGGLVAKTGRPIVIDSLDLWAKKDPVFHETKLFEAAIAYPVIIRGETVGVLQINREKTDRPFDNSDLLLLKQVADQTAMAIDYYYLSEQNRSFDLFRQMVWQVGTATHLDVLIDNGLTLINRNLSADIGFTQILDAQATLGLPIDVSKKLLVEMQEKSRLISRILVTYDWKVKDVSSAKFAKVMTSAGIRSSIIAPIVIEGESVGYLGVCSSTVRHWTQTEINTVEMTAKQLGMIASHLVSTRVSVSLEEMLLRYNVVTGNLNHQ
ncbi:MAG: GAF domain-containing protein, partial [Chloroflexota bacterium]